MSEPKEDLDWLVAEYYKWVTGQGGMPPQVLLAKPLSACERQELLQAMNDTNIALAFSEYVRGAISTEIAPSTISAGVPNRG